jgi:hypothetical protein
MNVAATPGNVIMICPNLKCRKVLQVSAQYRGKFVKCKYCHTAFTVPAEPARKQRTAPEDAENNPRPPTTLS